MSDLDDAIGSEVELYTLPGGAGVKTYTIKPLCWQQMPDKSWGAFAFDCKLTVVYRPSTYYGAGPMTGWRWYSDSYGYWSEQGYATSEEAKEAAEESYHREGVRHWLNEVQP